jgi:predicted nucleic acid-binding protein
VIRLVVDSSVGPKWWFNEEDAAEAALLRHRDVDLIAPDLLMPEMLNVFVQKVRKRLAEYDHAARAAAELALVPIELFESLPLRVEAMRLALAYHPSTYDCLYAALALREGCPVVTADRPFYDALHGPHPEAVLWLADLPRFLQARIP